MLDQQEDARRGQQEARNTHAAGQWLWPWQWQWLAPDAAAQRVARDTATVKKRGYAGA